MLAGTLAAVTVIPHWLVLRTDPADLGLHPDGAGRRRRAIYGASRRARGGPAATAGWAVREPVFRWYAAAFATHAAAVIIVAVHLVRSCAGTASAGFAAYATGALGALSVSGRLVLTGAVGRVPVAVVTALMFALRGAGVIVLLAAGSSSAGAVAFVLLFGLGFGVGTIARPTLMAHSFGVARYATLAGLMTLITTLATTAGPFAAGLARTLTGSYTPALVGVLVLCAAAAAPCCVQRGALVRSRQGTGPSTAVSAGVNGR